jgi:hypothetical protein
MIGSGRRNIETAELFENSLKSVTYVDFTAYLSSEEKIVIQRPAYWLNILISPYLIRALLLVY